LEEKSIIYVFSKSEKGDNPFGKGKIDKTLSADACNLFGGETYQFNSEQTQIKADLGQVDRKTRRCDIIDKNSISNSHRNPKTKVIN
jgi:hypothetical protein